MMPAMLIALAVWLILRALERRPQASDYSPCLICQATIHWDGRHFVHADGQVRWPYSPPLYFDPLDESKGQLLHSAIKAD